MKALIVCHKTLQDSGTIYDVLQERGFEITAVMGYHDKLPDIDPLAHDLTVFMGGPMGVYNADSFPYLNNEVAYLKARLAADKPTLGVCLGAQLMAKTLGEEVYPGKQGKEIGWNMITVLDRSGPARHLDGDAVKIMQWHGDTFDLPDKARLLASSPLYTNQIYTYGSKAMALQCHLEVTQDILELWMATGMDDLKNIGLSVSEFRSQVHKLSEPLKKQATLFLNEWLDEVMA